MSDSLIINGIAAALPLANLDTDQIMPKQFLRGIDKSGLDKGVLYDMRFDADGIVRNDFVLNRPGYDKTKILIAGSNFGCGSSREHAVWGLQQFGIQAIIASSFGEIFYSNAMNNQLLLIMLSDTDVQTLMADAANPETCQIIIDIRALTVQSHSLATTFTLAERYHQMFIENLDFIGSSLTFREAIDRYTEDHWARQPWLKDVASLTRNRLSGQDSIT
ncbi:3-isopropylmalate dehydratase small subunit [Candidimonas sp. SYP-B2681]|uniref:3-isopropylmalate dehydratase small subunit n=1 Tax=Candidimonas sp. SYP-B2681 TaxID=2497686 RepID=UPI000F89661A|nr:3-isopropylmalate dehydratase small subunit [Candidimonas sp. SYP-B2681]RTZ47993.1 3-isopropylmalate dehydratase small subunit [Candidimonas sp. SYP-B2681]